MSLSALLIGLGLLAALGIAAYVLSDTFRTRTDRAIRQLTEWTPEQIAADPDAYLEFAEQRIDQTREKLRELQVVARQQAASLDESLTKQSQRVQVGSAELARLQTLYVEANMADQWPVTYRGRELDEGDLQQQILLLDRSVRSSVGVRQSLQETLERNVEQRRGMATALADCEDQVGKLNALKKRRAANRTDAAQRELLALHESLKSSVAAVAEPPKVRTLEELVREHELQVQQRDFERVMSGGDPTRADPKSSETGDPKAPDRAGNDAECR